MQHFSFFETFKNGVKFPIDSRVKHGKTVFKFQRAMTVPFTSDLPYRQFSESTASAFNPNFGAQMMSTRKSTDNNTNETQEVNDAVSFAPSYDQNGVVVELSMALSDGCGHFDQVDIARHARRTAGGAVKFLSKISEHEAARFASSIVQAVETRVYNRQKIKTQEGKPAWSSDGATLLAGKAFYCGPDYQLSLMNIGDGSCFVYTPSDRQVKQLMFAKERQVESRYVPDAMSMGTGYQSLVESVTYTLEEGAIVFFISDGALTALPQIESIIEQHHNFYYRVTRLDTNALANILNNERSNNTTVQDDLDKLRAYIIRSQEEYRQSIVLLIENLKGISSQVLISTLISDTAENKLLKDSILRFKKRSPNKKIESVSDLQQLLNNYSIGDDVTIAAMQLPYHQHELLKAFINSSEKDQISLARRLIKANFNVENDPKKVQLIGNSLGISEVEVLQWDSLIILKIMELYKQALDQFCNKNLISDDYIRRILKGIAIALGELKDFNRVNNFVDLSARELICIVECFCIPQFRADPLTLQETFNQLVRKPLNNSAEIAVCFLDIRLKLVIDLIYLCDELENNTFSSGIDAYIKEVRKKQRNDYVKLMHEKFFQLLQLEQYKQPYYRGQLVCDFINNLTDAITKFYDDLDEAQRTINLFDRHGGKLDLKNLDLKGLNFRYVRFKNAELANTNFSGSLETGAALLNAALLPAISMLDAQSLLKLRQLKYDFVMAKLANLHEEIDSLFPGIADYRYLLAFACDGNDPDLSVIPDEKFNFLVLSFLRSPNLYPETTGESGLPYDKQPGNQFLHRMLEQDTNTFLSFPKNKVMEILNEFYMLCGKKLSLALLTKEQSIKTALKFDTIKSTIENVISDIEYTIEVLFEEEQKLVLQAALSRLKDYVKLKLKNDFIEQAVKKSDQAYINVALNEFVRQINSQNSENAYKHLKANILRFVYGRYEFLVDFSDINISNFDFEQIDLRHINVKFTQAQFHSLPDKTKLQRAADLREAVEAGDLEKVRLIVEGGIDINYQEPLTGYTVLMTACIQGSYQIAQFLLEKGADPKIPAATGAKIIDTMSFLFEWNFVALLKQYGGELNYHGMIACYQYDQDPATLELVKDIIATFPDDDMESELAVDKINKLLAVHQTRYSQPFLHFLARFATSELLSLALRNKWVNKNELDDKNKSLLYVAAMAGNVENVKKLLSLEVSLAIGCENLLDQIVCELQKLESRFHRLQAKEDETDQHQLIVQIKNFNQILDLLWNANLSYTLLTGIYLFKRGYVGISQLAQLLSVEKDCDVIFNSLLKACELDCREVVEIILNFDMKIDFNSLATFNNPLTSASELGFIDLVILLHRAGINIPKVEVESDKLANNHRHPLVKAVQRGHFEVSQYLLKYMEHANILLSSHYTILFDAINLQREDLVALLINHDCKVEFEDENANTPLHRAAKLGNQAIVQLIQDGYLTQTKNKKFETPLSIAVGAGHTLFVRRIEERQQVLQSPGSTLHGQTELFRIRN